MPGRRDLCCLLVEKCIHKNTMRAQTVSIPSHETQERLFIGAVEFWFAARGRKLKPDDTCAGRNPTPAKPTAKNSPPKGWSPPCCPGMVYGRRDAKK